MSTLGVPRGSMTSRRATTCCSSTEAQGPTNKARRRAPSESFSRNPIVARCLATVAEKVGPVGSPHEAEYQALIRGLKLAAEKRLRYVAAFSDSANVVNQITRGWNKNERATELYKEAKEALKPFKTWQLSWRDEQRGRQGLSIKPSKASP
jgi:hypothetical protein